MGSFVKSLTTEEFLHQSLHLVVHAVDCVFWICEILVLCLVHYLGQPHHPPCRPVTNKQSACQWI